MVQIYENSLYTDDIDTLLVRDAMFIVVFDTDENRQPQTVETIRKWIAEAGLDAAEVVHDGLIVARAQRRP